MMLEVESIHLPDVSPLTHQSDTYTMEEIKRAIEIYRSEGALSLAHSIGSYFNHNFRRPFDNFYRTKKHHLLYGEAAPDSYELIHVDPDKINYMIVPALRYRTPRFGTYVLDGDWDDLPVKDSYFSTREFKKEDRGPALLPFSEYGLYQSIHQHYLDNVPWEETEWYQYLISIISHLEYDSEKEVLEYFKGIDNLYDKINKNGYRSQKELHTSKTNKSQQKVPMDEILVDIDRTGRLLFEDGRHRLSIAKVLGIEQIPVRVLVRHSEWQKVRNRAASQNITEDNNELQLPLDHPDIQNLL